MSPATLKTLLPVRLAQACVDLVLFAACFAAAYLIRFEGRIPEQFLKQMIVLLPYVALARFGLIAVFGLYRVVWRYIGLREAVRFAQAIAALTFPLLALRLLYTGGNPYLKVPVGVLVLEGLLSFVAITSVRFLRRVQHERRRRRAGVHSLPRRPEPKATVLVGAGDAGLALVRETTRAAELGIQPVAFLDDDLIKIGMEVHGVRVVGTLDDLARAVTTTHASQVLITTNAIPSAKVIQITESARELGVEVRIVPGLYEILGSHLERPIFREVRIQDLLLRDPVKPSLTLADLNESYGERVLLVTGAGGSIGSELSRQLLLLRPRKIVLVERDETNLFDIDHELERIDSTIPRVPILADVTSVDALDAVFREHVPDAIFHAAAYKHVPMMERFPALAVLNNILGTSRLIDAAIKYQSESFLMISTDKAVNPSSVMGATKRIAELVVQRAARVSETTRFSCVRFGNVLGSRGSVVGIFREQIRKGGPVTVTHPDAKRYFMTVEEAVNLVLQASTLGENGEVFMLDMGEPIRIVDLARQMIRLSGLSESEIPIEFVGVRAGEKLFEELSLDREAIQPTALRKISRCTPVALDSALLTGLVDRFEPLVGASDHDGVRELLTALDIGYSGSSRLPARVTGQHIVMRPAEQP